MSRFLNIYNHFPINLLHFGFLKHNNLHGFGQNFLSKLLILEPSPQKF